MGAEMKFSTIVSTVPTEKSTISRIMVPVSIIPTVRDTDEGE